MTDDGVGKSVMLDILIEEHTGLTAALACSYGDRDGTVVKVLRYKSEGHWFDSRWCHWNFSLT